MRNKEYGMIYEDDGNVVGICVVIPLNESGWKKLINGELAESDTDEKTIFDNSRDKKIGLHIYPIEKLDVDIKEFHKTCLKDISKLIKRSKKSNDSLKVAGLSGLCVTKSGINLFKNKFNCTEREYIYKENIYEKNSKLKVFEIKTESEMKKIEKEGYDLVNRCEMLVTYPYEKSIVWEIIDL